MTERRTSRSIAVCVITVLGAIAGPARAQDRLRTMPGYEQYQRMRGQIPGSVQSGALAVTWAEDGKTFSWVQAGTTYRYDPAVRRATAVPDSAVQAGGRGGRGGRGGGGPERGRQFDAAPSPDGKLNAFYRDRNLHVSHADGTNEFAITTDGTAAARTKYGTGSWVYGEELGQNTAIWWSPDGTKLAFYGFDESGVPDYYLQLDQTKLQSTVDVEAYPKAGVTNPVVNVHVYDFTTRTTTKLDVRGGRSADDDVVGHYAYRVGWTPDGREVTLNRTNRHQNIMEFAACSPSTGACRTIVREEWPTGWVENSPFMQILEGRRFLWMSERTGWSNLYLYDFDGRLLSTVTNHAFEVANVLRVDEKAGVVWYMVRDGDNHMKLQLHRVRLDGRGDRRLTDPAFNHTISLSPDGRYFIDITQTHDQPPVTILRDGDGKLVAELAKTDLTKFEQLGLKKAELFTFKAADGVTDLHGMLYKPSNFDPARKYPLLISVYAGPATNGARETFATPNPLTEYGFLVATLDSRSAAGRGKKFLDAIYQKLGTVEVDDQAAGAKALAQRPYIDPARVAIFGTSYGGYVSAMAIVRHPDVFAAATASSAVTDWRHYDTIYTERYMRTPQENKAGYDAGSVMTYVDRLKGRLMIYYGTADNNVHPSNAMELIAALQRAGKSFDLQIGPDRGHSAISQDRMMEFLIEQIGR